MRPLITISAVLTLMPIHAALAKGTCEDAGGKCVAGGEDCQEMLNLTCDNGATCCTQESPPPIRYVSKKCRQKKQCERKKGKCVRKWDTCRGKTKDEWCRGKTCTCCIPRKKKEKCKDTPKCLGYGGFCFKSKTKRMCKDRPVMAGVCKSVKCSCCLPPNVCVCGLANGDRIVGGKEATPNEFPWLVGLQLGGDKTKYKCSGSIINNMYILTAAHCLFDQVRQAPMNPADIKVGIADHNQFSQDDDVPGVTRLVDVQNVIIHPGYDLFDVPDDIGLLKLSEPLNLTSNREVRPVCLPQNDAQTYEGLVGTHVGWGLTSESANEQPDVLMVAEITVLGPDCDNNTQIAGFNLSETNLCAGEEEGGVDSCEGDSGGPITVIEDGSYVVVGLSSFGDGCARPNIPGVYTRVSKYLEWIEENTQNATDCD